MKLKKISLYLLISAAMLNISGFKAYAAEKTQDGIKLTISADKTDYDEDDKIVASITLENNSGNDITDVTAEGAVPDKYRLSDESKAIRRTTYLKSGDSLNYELELIPEKKEVKAADKKEEKAVVTEKSEVKELKNPENGALNSDKNDSKSENKNAVSMAEIIIVGILLLAVSGAVVLLVTKGKNKGIMILVCITAAGSFAPKLKATAIETENYNLSVSETVTVAGKKYELTAVVRYTMDKPDMQAAVEEYYEDNSEEIISVESVEENDSVFSEKEAIKFMSERGFTEYPLKYDYTIDGTYTDEAEASAESDEKHPMYMTYFIAEDGAVWSVFIVGRTIAANPASYNLESDLETQVLVSETDTLTSYTEMGNKFYQTIPKESAVKLKVVDQITSQKLNDLTYEEVIN